MPKVFILGATGYIGGDALETIIQAHPEWSITAQARNSTKGAKIAAMYPRVTLVYGDLDSSDMIEEQSFQSDIVYNFANCDHAASTAAALKGLSRRTDPSYYIHTSGTMILSPEFVSNGPYGEPSNKVYDDWDRISELTTFPDSAAHRVVDKLVLAVSAASPNIRTAIVCPPMIYGTGRGPDNQKSRQVYLAARLTLQDRRGFRIGQGLNIWHSVHVHDLSDLFLLLGEAAVAGGHPATWNSDGYYLAENGKEVMGDLCQRIAAISHDKSLIPHREITTLPSIDARPLGHSVAKSLGTNSRGMSIRAKKLLGWKPHRQSIEDELTNIVDGEARELGLIKSHADKVTE